MSRSPLFYPLNRGMDAEAGGAADLQTDVMRFMAILSLCLVAIFALVQSIPLAPPPVAAQADPPAEIKVPESVVVPVEKLPAKAAPEPLTIVTLVRPEPQKLPLREQSTTLQRPRPEAVASQPKAEPQESPAARPIANATTPQASQQGFTLRFDNDQALTRLVARNDVGLYAMLPEQSLRMNVNRGQLNFWPASLPREFHEMDESTVPDEVLAALLRGHDASAGQAKWGVTIPAATRRQLDRFLHEASGGTLIIDADGGLRLER